MPRLLLRLSQLASTSKRPGLLPVSPTTIWRMVKAREFPQPFKLGKKCTVWDAAEVESFIQRQRVTQEAASKIRRGK
jgi:predicted DNA-binding transcriptional regulator AlpA